MNIKSLSFLFLLIIFAACSRKKWDEEVKKIPLPSTSTYGKLNDVLVDKSGKIHIVGGDRFERNDFYQSDDNGLTWQLFHFDQVLYANKTIFAITEHNDALYAASFDGKVFKNNTGINNAWYLGLGDAWWYAFTGITFTKNGFGFAAGNAGYASGLITKFDTTLQTLQIDSFPFAINDISFVDNQIGYAVGYGALLQTKDAGASWQQLNLTDDNYRSIFIVDKDNIWTVGFNGTIAQISNDASKIKKLKNGQNPIGNTDRYLDITFKGNEGYIVGEKGLVKYSNDGGKNWRKMKKFTNEDLHAVCIHPSSNTVYFVGDNNAAFYYQY